MKCFCFTVPCVQVLFPFFFILSLWLTVFLLGCFFVFFFTLELSLFVWREKKCTYSGVIVIWRAVWGPARFRRPRWCFLFYYYFFFLVFTASHDTQSRGDAARRPSVGSRCCILTCRCLLAWLLRQREVSTAAVTLGNTCWQCRLHTSGLSATGAIDSHQVICDAFLPVWQFVFVFICLIYLFGGKRKKKEEEENGICFLFFF